MPLQTCTFQRTILDATTLNGLTSYVSPGKIFDQTAGQTFFVLQVSGRSVGTLTASLQGSGDGSTWYDLSADLTVVMGRNGYGYIVTRRGLPIYLRLELTPAGGFDGQLTVYARSAGLIGTPRSTSIQYS